MVDELLPGWRWSSPTVPPELFGFSNPEHVDLCVVPLLPPVPPFLEGSIYAGVGAWINLALTITLGDSV